MTSQASSVPKRAKSRDVQDDKSTEVEVLPSTTDDAQIVPCFPLLRLPVELQCMVVAAAVKKPGCHEVAIDKVALSDVHKSLDQFNTDEWSLTLRPVLKDLQCSSFFGWRTLAQTSFSIRAMLKMNMIEPVDVSLDRIRGQKHAPRDLTQKLRIDAATDLIVVRHTRAAYLCNPLFRWSDQLRALPWNHMNLDMIRERMRPLRRIGIRLKLAGSFSCDRNQHHVCVEGKFCPREVAFFLNIFPSLEAFYIIVEPSKAAVWRDWARNYRGRPLGTERTPDLVDFYIWTDASTATVQRYNQSTSSHGSRSGRATIIHYHHAHSDFIPAEVGWTRSSSDFRNSKAYVRASRLLKEAFRYYRDPLHQLHNTIKQRRAVKFGVLIELPAAA